LEFDIGFLLDVYFLIRSGGHQDRDFPGHVQSRFPMIANTGPRSLQRDRRSVLDGIWYASNGIVKAGREIEVSKTRAT
jgi:hypothetical protein